MKIFENEGITDVIEKGEPVEAWRGLYKLLNILRFLKSGFFYF